VGRLIKYKGKKSYYNYFVITYLSLLFRLEIMNSVEFLDKYTILV